MDLRAVWLSISTRVSAALSFADDFRHPRFAVALALALPVSLLACWPTWPGYMSFDSLFAWHESIYGIETAVWPPMQAYLSWLSRALTGGPGGYFFTQVFVIFFSMALIYSMAFGRRTAVVASFLVTVVIFIYFPTILGVLGVLWKDVTTASLALLGLALWLVAVRYTSFAALLAAIVIYCLGVAIRYNAIPLFAPLMLLMIVSPLGGREFKGCRVAVAMALVVGLALAYASATWRLPDFHKLPSDRGFSGVQQFDLMGVTACSNIDYIPLAMSSGRPITPADVRAVYDPRHVQMAFGKVHGHAPPLIETDAGGDVGRMWSKAVSEQFGCYLAHRATVFVEQMGMAKGEVFYPTHGGIDDNPYGIKLAHPRLSQAFNAFVATAAPHVLRRPAWLYLGAALATVTLLAFGRRGKAVVTAMFLGAVAYPGTLFLVGPAADARYIFPSNVFCVLILVLAAPLALEGMMRRGSGSDLVFAGAVGGGFSADGERV